MRMTLPQDYIAELEHHAFDALTTLKDCSVELDARALLLLLNEVVQARRETVQEEPQWRSMSQAM